MIPVIWSQLDMRLYAYIHWLLDCLYRTGYVASNMMVTNDE
jgi:hypothetical protein